ncbi:hypothetical protein MJ1_0644 [Nanobdella aerobiophila]|uniref:Uncharacterized protein n=1 Tax=Nanobdella aerobiophila TaxID=2586965 RepID=A0A915WRZ3_9ARCH|nr:hypothetical protein [Nanobdella aerobiophila]BBL45789.1 hypothetical protein MJ1_0644 [Nanobdella aerobiophila]
MKIILTGLDKDFIESAKFLKNSENIMIENDEIIINSESISVGRAKINLLYRLLRIYDNFNRFLSNL